MTQDNYQDYRKRLYQRYVSTHLGNIRRYSIDNLDRTIRDYKKRYKRFLPRNKDARIIDVACGVGEFVLFLQKEGYRNAMGIDIGEEQIALGREIGVQNLIIGDAFGFLKEKRGYFDLITAHDLIEHFTKDELLDFLDACINALKPGGELWLSTPNAQTLIDVYRYGDFTHEMGFTPASLKQILRTTGFEDIRIYPKGPVMIDFRSAVRYAVWSIFSRLITLYLVVAEGTGRGALRYYNVVTSVMFAIARRPVESVAGGSE